MRWSQVPFESVFLVPPKNGLTRPSIVRGSGIPMINMGELFAHDRIGSIEMELVPVNERELDSMLVEKGDLLFARQSLVLSGAGKCSFVQAAEVPTTFESHIIRVRLNQVVANPLFFHYYFKSPACGMTSIVTQGVQAGIRGSDLKRLPVLLPPLTVQNRIAESIAQYDDLIENNRRRMALLEEAARQLYREWFVRLRFPGHEHTRITNGVPEGWKEKTLGDLCKEVRETVKLDALEPSTPYIGLEHMPRRSISLSDWGTAEQVTSSKHRFREGEFLFGKIRPYFHKIGIAFVDGITSSDAIVIRPLESTLRGFVLMTVSSDPFVAVTAQTMREGSKMPRADWKQMQAHAVSLPTAYLLGSFESAIQIIVEQLRTLTFTNHRLRAARDLLLPRLMSGEIAA